MRQNFFLFLLASVFCIGCGKNLIETDLPIKVNKSETDSFVSMINVKEYVSRIWPQTRADVETDCSIEALLGADSDTLMYVVNYGNGQGWQILSADSRTPAILAEGKSGSFSLEGGSPALRVWMEGLKMNMSAVRQANDDGLKFSAEEIALNKTFWTGDQPRQEFPPVIEADGEYVVRTTSEIIVVDTLDHMVPKWDQDSPYNVYCPNRTDTSYLRSPVGCVAIAGSQVLKYLHDTLGVPSLIPSHCSLNGNTPVFSDYTNTVWNSMSYDYNVSSTDSVAVLLRYVGHLSGMHYNNDYSWALPANLRTNVINYLGISCSHGNYNENAVKSSLEDRMPVIVTATNLLIPLDGEIHSFVIDGFKKTYTKYTHHHFWEPYDPLAIPDLTLHPDYYTYSYTSPDITQIKINWGWCSQWLSGYHYNDDWYTLTDDWATVHNGSIVTWNYNRQMIYGFVVE